MRRYNAPGVTIPDVMRELENWLRGEGFNYQDLKTEDGGTLIQIEQQGGWRKFVGMSSALNIILCKKDDELTVEIGAGQWFDKAAAGVVSLFLLWPLAVTAAIGAWNQMKLPERVFTRIADLVASKRVLPAPAPTTGGLSADRITQLRELATLRDQGILTDEEFQAEKARILGR
jgi:Short C-terminal domain